MQITIKARNLKHEQRLKRWIPFMDNAFQTMRGYLPAKAKSRLPDKITFRPLTVRKHPQYGFALSFYRGRMGKTGDGEWWLAIWMEASTNKFRDTLLHEIAHFDAIAIDNNWQCIAVEKGKRVIRNPKWWSMLFGGLHQ